MVKEACDGLGHVSPSFSSCGLVVACMCDVCSRNAVMKGISLCCKTACGSEMLCIILGHVVVVVYLRQIT
eukprot:346539-Chlamydomonas_euryale.AAC.6